MCVIETNYSYLCKLEEHEMAEWLSKLILLDNPPWCIGEEKCTYEMQCIECVYRWLMGKYIFEKGEQL